MYRKLALGGVVAACLLLSACSSNEPQERSSSTAQQETASASSSNSSDQNFDPMQKYDPPIEVTTVRSMNPSIVWDEGESYERNGVYAAYENDLGIKIRNLWSVDSSQYDQKVNIAIASGDIPDLMQVNSVQFQQLLDADMIMDIGEAFEKYATPYTKEYVTRDGGGQLDSTKINGKMMALPYTNGVHNDSTFLFIRKDWLDKLGLQPPKTMQDLEAVSTAFTRNDPDGNGKDDTFGLALQKDLMSGSLGLQGFFNGFHAYPNIWLKNEAGELVYGSIQPEVRNALAKLKEMYKNGEIDQEFGVKDLAKEAELIAQDKIGITYGLFWTGNYPLQSGAVKDGKVVQDWGVYPIVAADDQIAKTQLQKSTGLYYVVSKKAKNPEAIIKMYNQSIWAMDAPASDPNAVKYVKGKIQIEGGADQTYYVLNPTFVGKQDRFPVVGKTISKALAEKDPTLLPDSELILYNFMTDYLNGNTDHWGYAIQLEQGGTLETMYQYTQENRFVFNEFYGALTPSMAEKNSTLTKKQDEVFTKIIVGAAPLEEFDSFVEQWKSLGGNDITQEVNEWHQSVKQ